MKKLLLLFFLLGTSVFTACDEEDDEIPQLDGTIGGEMWFYKYSKAIFNSVDQVFDVEMYGARQSESDPCSIFISGETHLSVQIPNETGYFVIPSDIDVVFEQEGTGNEAFNATSGYVEILSASSQQINGIMSADYDDGNTVEGSFFFERCN